MIGTRARFPRKNRLARFLKGLVDFLLLLLLFQNRKLKREFDFPNENRLNRLFFRFFSFFYSNLTICVPERTNPSIGERVIFDHDSTCTTVCLSRPRIVTRNVTLVSAWVTIIYQVLSRYALTPKSRRLRWVFENEKLSRVIRVIGGNSLFGEYVSTVSLRGFNRIKGRLVLPKKKSFRFTKPINVVLKFDRNPFNKFDDYIFIHWRNL